MSVRQWKPSARAGNPATVMSTDLNSLADGAAVLSGALSNDANDELDLYADVELLFTAAAAPDADMTLDLYVVRSVDGTNFEDATAARPPASGYVGSFVSANSTGAQRLVVPRVELPPEDFKLLLVNNLGAALVASGNVLTALFYTEQVV